MGHVKSRIYIVHGWTYTIEPWADTVRELERLGWDVRQLRVPGLTSPSDTVWTIDGYVEWLHGELVHDKHPVVLGHSNGGRIALNYSLAYPGHIEKLLLLNSAGVYDDRLMTRAKKGFFRLGSIVLRPLKKVPFLRRVVYRLAGAGDYNQAPENMKKTLQNMLDSDKKLHIENVQVTTRILWGNEDRATPLWQGAQIQHSIKGSTIDVHPGWAHAPYRTHPIELAEAIDRAGRS